MALRNRPRSQRTHASALHVHGGVSNCAPSTHILVRPLHYPVCGAAVRAARRAAATQQPWAMCRHHSARCTCLLGVAGVCRAPQKARLGTLSKLHYSVYCRRGPYAHRAVFNAVPRALVIRTVRSPLRARPLWTSTACLACSRAVQALIVASATRGRSLELICRYACMRLRIGGCGTFLVGTVVATCHDSPFLVNAYCCRIVLVQNLDC